MSKQYKQRIGSRRQVWNGTALMTSGGLKKKDIKKNKRGDLVSKRKSERAKQEWGTSKSALYMCLEANDLIPVKGHFQLVPKGACAKPVRRRKQKRKPVVSRKLKTKKRTVKKHMTCSEAGRRLRQTHSSEAARRLVGCRMDCCHL